MIVGRFSSDGRPFVQGRVKIPRLQVDDKVDFLLDTGADSTCLHPDDVTSLRIPVSKLSNLAPSRGVGGASAYYLEDAVLIFTDGGMSRFYAVTLLVAAAPNEHSRDLPSLLGRNVINNWAVEYDPTNARLECTVRRADYTLGA